MNKHGPSKHIHTYRIYQIDPEISEESRSRLFCSYNELIRQQKQIDPTLYRKVYEGEIVGETRTALESLWLRFNEFHPKDFTGRSMSISDIIVLDRNQKETPFYVDTFGFQKLERKIKMEE